MQISISFDVRLAVPKVVENYKCTERPYDDLEHLTVQRILCAYTPEAQSLVCFTFERRLVQMCRMTSEWFRSNLPCVLY